LWVDDNEENYRDAAVTVPFLLSVDGHPFEGLLLANYVI
jgi:hypothetical protein